jgi:hypothetical protein
MKTFIKKSIQWTLAITAALALKFGLLFCYSAYKLRSSLTKDQRTIASSQAQAVDKPLMYKLWDQIVYF